MGTTLGNIIGVDIAMGIDEVINIYLLHTMIYYKKIDIDFYDEIVEDTLNYLKNYKPDVYNLTIPATYNVLDLAEFKRYCPKLDLGFAKYNIVCNFAVAFVMNKTSDVKLHIDNYSLGIARINIPILNTSNTYTRFYTGGEFVKVTNPVTNISALRLSGNKDLRTVAGVEIDKATVMRVNVPHDILKLNPGTPRITLTLGFDRDPVFLLED